MPKCGTLKLVCKAKDTDRKYIVNISINATVEINYPEKNQSVDSLKGEMYDCVKDLIDKFNIDNYVITLSD